MITVCPIFPCRLNGRILGFGPNDCGSNPHEGAQRKGGLRTDVSLGLVTGHALFLKSVKCKLTKHLHLKALGPTKTPYNWAIPSQILMWHRSRTIHFSELSRLCHIKRAISIKVMLRSLKAKKKDQYLHGLLPQRRIHVQESSVWFGSFDSCIDSGILCTCKPTQEGT